MKLSHIGHTITLKNKISLLRIKVVSLNKDTGYYDTELIESSGPMISGYNSLYKKKGSYGDKSLFGRKITEMLETKKYSKPSICYDDSKYIISISTITDKINKLLKL